MLKEKVTGSSGSLPPDLPGGGTDPVTVAGVMSANDSDYGQARRLARRMRRQRRGARQALRARGGWTVGLG